MFLEPDEQVETEEVFEASNEDYIQIKRSHFNILLISILVPLAFLIGISSGYLIWGDNQAGSSNTVASGDTNSPPDNVVPGPTEEMPRFEIPADDDPYLGPEDAPILIVEFSDFNCGFCRRFHSETFNALLEEYPDQIRFVYRDYPITSQESFYAAQAAECAHEQGKFWDYHDLLFSGGLTLGRDTYVSYAEELGMDSEDLVNCLDSERYAEEVSGDASFASNLGLTGTPTFFINGIPLVGAQPLSQFTAVIDEELAN
jgi:protein-disulfide isomerase